MTQPVLLKVYGNLWPAGNALFRQVSSVCEKAVSLEQPIVFLEGDLLRVSFEGVYFPLDEVMEIIKNSIAPNMRGKMDYIDLEEWKMTRFIFADGKIIANSSPLNNVLDYSGF